MVAVVRDRRAGVTAGCCRAALISIAVPGLVGLLGLIVSAMAQPLSPPPSGRTGAREGVRLIETIRIWKMTEALQLTEDQATKLFPKLTQLEALRRGFRRQQRLLRDELAGLLKQRPLREGDIKARLEALERIESDFRERERTVRGELQSILSLEQQARLTLFEERFEAEMRRTILDLRRRRQAWPSGRPPLPVEGGTPSR